MECYQTYVQTSYQKFLWALLKRIKIQNNYKQPEFNIPSFDFDTLSQCRTATLINALRSPEPDKG